MKTHFISGHLDLTPEEFELHYEGRILEAIREGGSFVVGDARGTDHMAQQFLKKIIMDNMLFDLDVTVFHMFESPRHNAGSFPTQGGYKTDSARDRAMTAASENDIAWVRPGREKSGTARNLARRDR